MNIKPSLAITLCFAGACAFVVGCAKTSSSPDAPPKTIMQTATPEGDCDKFRASLPADWFQGFVTVPEDPAQPGGAKISVFYYGKINPDSVPTMYFNGGPLASSHSEYSALSRRQNLFDPKKHVSLVFLDQRGNGCSQGFPQGKDPATLQRLSLYGSRGIAADAEAVRLQVWGKPWIAAGQSYGGYIVHRYAVLYPDSLTAAISQQDVITSDGYSRIKTRIASQARVLEKYFSQYPDDRDRLTRLKKYLDMSKCFANPHGAGKRCGLAAISPLTLVIGFSNNWLLMHQWLGIMAPGKDVSDDGIARYLAVYAFGGIADPGNSKNVAGIVIDYVDRNVAPMNTANCEKIRVELLPKGIDLDQVQLNECMVQLQDNSAYDDSVWHKYLKQDPLTIADFATALTTHNWPFYLYSSEKDTFVPVEQFAEELAAIGTLPNVHYTDFQGTGHDASSEEPQTWADWITLSARAN